MLHFQIKHTKQLRPLNKVDAGFYNKLINSIKQIFESKKKATKK